MPLPVPRRGRKPQRFKAAPPTPDATARRLLPLGALAAGFGLMPLQALSQTPAPAGPAAAAPAPAGSAAVQPELQLRADQAVAYRYVAQTLADASKAGLSRIGFVSEPESSP